MGNDGTNTIQLTKRFIWSDGLSVPDLPKKKSEIRQSAGLKRSWLLRFLRQKFCVGLLESVPLASDAGSFRSCK
jgi:hypothetical protein